MKNRENVSADNGTVLMPDDGQTVPMPDTEGTALMSDDDTRTMPMPDGDTGTALMQDDDTGTALMQDDDTHTMPMADNTNTAAVADDDNTGAMRNVNRSQTGLRGGGYIPDEVCGDDIVDVRPLNEVGGFSNLFRAHKKGLDVDVVIKRVKKQYAGRLDEQSEARIMTALRHQYLPRIYDFKYASDGYTYTIMELIEGCTLRKYVKERGSLDQKLVLKWTRQLCEAIAYMHSRKPSIVHSDLKPENVMITPFEDICVIDFNASLEIDDDSAGAEAIGVTPGYAAPEQYCRPLEKFKPDNPFYSYIEAAQGMGRVDARTDIYAIGALAYYMLTGYDPKPWKDGIVPLEQYDITLGYAFGSIIKKAMEPKQSARYKSAAGMLTALGNLKKYDKRYKSLLMQSRIASVIIAFGLAASAFLIVEGLQQIKVENTEAYLSIVSTAGDLRTEGRYEEAESLLREALMKDSARIEAYLELGTLLFNEGRCSEAIALLEGITFRNSGGDDEAVFMKNSAEMNFIIASCYYQMEDYFSALEHYQLASAYWPDKSNYLRDLAICYAKTGNMDMAKSTLEMLRNTDCMPLELALVDGEICYANGEYEAAYTRLIETAQLATDSTLISRSYILAAQCCQQLGSAWLEREVALLENAVSKVGIENGIIVQMLSEAYIRQYTVSNGQNVTALERAHGNLTQLISRGYVTYAIMQNNAVVLQYLGRYDEAELCLKEMLDDYPNNYRVPMRLAMLYIDREGKKAINERDYTEFGQYLAKARTLYKNSAVQDSEMIRLEDLAAQLKEYGWEY